jgi:hypothetical protein
LRTRFTVFGLLLVVGVLFTFGACQRIQEGDLELKRWQGKIAYLESQIGELAARYEALEKQASDVVDRAYDPGNVADGRLTTESGVAVSTSDRSAQSTLYYTPFHGSRISLYTGTRWKIYEFSEVSLALSSLSSNTNYDVFIYDASGTLTLELTAWSSDTARATAIALTDGIYLKNSDTSRRYLGTIRTTSTSTTEDSRTKRFVWNAYHRVTQVLYVTDSTDSWTYGTSSWRSTNASTANRVEFVVGDASPSLFVRSMHLALSSSGTSNYLASGVGLDSTTVDSTQMRGSGTVDSAVKQVWGYYVGHPGLGYHYVQWLEQSNTTSITLYGDNGDSTKYLTGLLGELRG